ncbi:hypothetical protein PHLCEN_2v4712 [Hermanssonia centrifuga]|uniref:GPI inositol-deacylase PGAP1-like alpha/beta domain-containing protein n=1 Tax=Hermanssonia centrifuga TaxID=98765 RepID=A0A2R6PNB2_9APHY|nr:hypothetical protein PHLCEN_2v4712 [Hermanssonia centrifuga]
MSTPHTLPPARFDRHIDRIYTANQDNLARNPTPILSLCGGATDLMIPSESCILPTADREVDAVQPYRRSIFTSALEGSWTGVGHLAMVWCHQVRWRIARAALELGATSSASSRSVILDTWLRDGHRTSPKIDDTYGRYSDHLDLESEEVEVLPSELNLVLNNPHGSHTYILPGYASTFSKKFILYVFQGSIIPTSPQTALPLRASVFICPPQGFCTRMIPSSLKLVPSPILGRPFPVPDEGSDESEGVVVFEADMEVTGDMRVAVKVEGADGRGWIVGGFVQQEALFNNANSVGMYSAWCNFCNSTAELYLCFSVSGIPCAYCTEQFNPYDDPFPSPPIYCSDCL